MEPLCLICHRIRDDPIHNPRPRSQLAGREVRIKQHPFDPGERRHGNRRKKDREK